MRPTVGTDILKHHGPVMLTMLPLMLPYGLGIAAIEPSLPVPPPASSITLQVSGWGFVSSFNEFIMCPPSRDHARLKGPSRRDPLPLPGPRCMQNTSDASFFRSHEACTVELAYKVLIFTTFSSLGCLSVWRVVGNCFCWHAGLPGGTARSRCAISSFGSRKTHLVPARRTSRHLVVGGAKHAQLAGALERVVLPHVRHHHVPKSRAPRNLATPRPRQRPKCESESERAAEPAKASQDQQPPRVDGNPRRAGKGADAGCVNDSGLHSYDVINSSGRFSSRLFNATARLVLRTLPHADWVHMCMHTSVIES